jgi:hypothetical protein
MGYIYIPNEIIIIILNKITDTESYKNARLVCKYWHYILNDGKIFRANSLDTSIKYFNDRIDFLNSKNLLIAQVKFSNYGFYEYKKLNNNCVISIKSKPLEMNYTKNIGTYYESIKYNIITDKKSVQEHYIPQCLLM